MAVSKRTRFEVFKRDGFRCVYCGATPTQAFLRADHVEPKSKGGSDDALNLVTACQDCNGGKSDVRLTDKRLGQTLTGADAKDHAAQILGYLESQRDLVAAKEEVCEHLRGVWEELIGEGTTASERGVIRSFASQYAMSDLVDAMHVAAGRFAGDSSRSFRYLCGIVRRWRETGIVTIEFHPGTTRRG